MQLAQCAVDILAVAFEAASRDDAIVVAVGASGNTLGVELQAPATHLSEAELANRIMKLNTLAHLRSQLALRNELQARGAAASPALATQEQVRAFESLIDF